MRRAGARTERGGAGPAQPRRQHGRRREVDADNSPANPANGRRLGQRRHQLLGQSRAEARGAPYYRHLGQRRGAAAEVGPDLQHTRGALPTATHALRAREPAVVLRLRRQQHEAPWLAGRARGAGQPKPPAAHIGRRSERTRGGSGGASREARRWGVA
jgi:hypothetical protein